VQLIKFDKEYRGGVQYVQMSYKNTVQKIADLPWEKADPGDLIFLARGTAIEFASSLRKAVTLYPDDKMLSQMVNGELMTDNLSFEDYQQKGDHWQYLDYFVIKHNIKASCLNVQNAIDQYIVAMETLFTAEERAMTVFSREEELVHIFEEITSRVDWNSLAFSFYKNYLDSHIEFDSGEEGHHHLTEHYPLFPDTLERFYAIRLKMYQSLFD
jgi:hypothetical protein